MIWSIFLRNSLMVQWLGLHALTAKGTGSIPGRGTKIPQAMRSNQKVVFFYFVPCLNFTRNGFYWLCFSVYGPYFLVHVSIFCWKMNILNNTVTLQIRFSPSPETCYNCYFFVVFLFSDVSKLIMSSLYSLLYVATEVAA